MSDLIGYLIYLWARICGPKEPRPDDMTTWPDSAFNETKEDDV